MSDRVAATCPTCGGPVWESERVPAWYLGTDMEPVTHYEPRLPDDVQAALIAARAELYRLVVTEGPVFRATSDTDMEPDRSMRAAVIAALECMPVVRQIDAALEHEEDSNG